MVHGVPGLRFHLFSFLMLQTELLLPTGFLSESYWPGMTQLVVMRSSLARDVMFQVRPFTLSWNYNEILL